MIIIQKKVFLKLEDILLIKKYFNKSCNCKSEAIKISNKKDFKNILLSYIQKGPLRKQRRFMKKMKKFIGSENNFSFKMNKNKIIGINAHSSRKFKMNFLNNNLS